MQFCCSCGGFLSSVVEVDGKSAPWVISIITYTHPSTSNFLKDAEQKKLSHRTTCKSFGEDSHNVIRSDFNTRKKVLNYYKNAIYKIQEDFSNYHYNHEKLKYKERMANHNSEKCVDRSISIDAETEIRKTIQEKAEKHSTYYRNLGDFDCESKSRKQMAKPVQQNVSSVKYSSSDCKIYAEVEKEYVWNECTPASKQRQRRTGVFQLDKDFKKEDTVFVCVKQMRDNYLSMLEETNHKFNATDKVEGAKNRRDTNLAAESFLIDETFLAPPPQSDYCSSSASGTSDDERDKNWYKHSQLRRSGSSDSAVGLNQSDDDSPGFSSPCLNKKEFPDTITHSQSYSINSPYSPRGSVDHTNVPSKTIIESKFVPYPLDRKLSMCGSEGVDCDDKNDSRRPSLITDDGEEVPRFRYWRTPSVVVSDYSDDVVGLSLEDIEFFRNQRKENSSSPDSSVHSSCSNLNYCGSTISNLDAEYILRTPFRKSSNCSTCSAFSGDEDTDNQSESTTNVKVGLIHF